MTIDNMARFWPSSPTTDATIDWAKPDISTTLPNTAPSRKAGK